MKLSTAKDIRIALQRAERDGMRLWISLDAHSDGSDVWAKVHRVRNHYNRSMGIKYPIVQTDGGLTVTIATHLGTPYGAFDIR